MKITKHSIVVRTLVSPTSDSTAIPREPSPTVSSQVYGPPQVKSLSVVWDKDLSEEQMSDIRKELTSDYVWFYETLDDEGKAFVNSLYAADPDLQAETDNIREMIFQFTMNREYTEYEDPILVQRKPFTRQDLVAHQHKYNNAYKASPRHGFTHLFKNYKKNSARR